MQNIYLCFCFSAIIKPSGSLYLVLIVVHILPSGAYYVNYYVKGGLIQNMTYQDGMLHYLDYANDLNIPYR